MKDDRRHDEEPDVYEDYEEYVDADEHEDALGFEPRPETGEEHEVEVYDDYHYGEDDDEAYEKEDV